MRNPIIFTLLLFLTGLSYIQAQAPRKKTASVTTNKRLAAAGNGEALYKQYCLSCHQADGSGVPGLNPPLIKTSYVLGEKVRLIKIVLNGFKEDVAINGVTYENVMPPLNYLDNQQVASVLTYVRSNFGNKASMVTTASVAAVRAGK